MLAQISFALVLVVVVGAALPIRRHEPAYHSQQPYTRVQHTPLQYQSTPVQYYNAPVSHQAAPRQYRHSPVQYQHSPVQYQHSPVQYQHSPVQYQQSQQPQYQHLQQPQYQSVPVSYAKVEPAIHHASSGHSQGAHGHQQAGHSASNYDQHSDQVVHKGADASTHGHHNVGIQNTHGIQGDNHDSHGTYQNVGSYSEDKGSGYEKSYSYDRATGHHDIEAEDSSNSKSQGTQSKEAHHNVGSHSAQTQEKQGSHSKTGSSEHAQHKSLFEKYGYSNGGKQQGYSYSPVYGYGYH